MAEGQTADGSEEAEMRSHSRPDPARVALWSQSAAALALNNTKTDDRSLGAAFGVAFFPDLWLKGHSGGQECLFTHFHLRSGRAPGLSFQCLEAERDSGAPRPRGPSQRSRHQDPRSLQSWGRKVLGIRCADDKRAMLKAPRWSRLP